MAHPARLSFHHCGARSAVAEARRRWREALYQFVGRPSSPRPLAFFRIGLAVILLIHAYAISGILQEFFGPLGIVQASLAKHLVHPALPSLANLLRMGERVGVPDFVGLSADRPSWKAP